MSEKQLPATRRERERERGHFESMYEFDYIIVWTVSTKFSVKLKLEIAIVEKRTLIKIALNKKFEKKIIMWLW